jgi:hypothetical protein
MRRLFLCDLDGTLIRPGHPLSPETLSCMERLVAQGDVVAIASGRSLYSGRNILRPGMPLSYWLFSTGAGILEWATGEIVCRNELSAEQVRHAAELLLDFQEDFMIQAPIPENHRFVYYKFDRRENEGTDFAKRCGAYPGLCEPFEPRNYAYQPSSQLIAVLPPEPARIERIRAALAGYAVIRATSPMDGHSVWLEIFNPAAGKANAAKWLAAHCGIPRENTFALGNDYNDLDMLNWAAHAFITPNAPDDMKARFPVTASDTEGALPEAVQAWLESGKRE